MRRAGTRRGVHSRGTNETTFEDKRGSQNFFAQEVYDRAGFWNHQACDGVPSVFASRNKIGSRRMAVGMYVMEYKEAPQDNERKGPPIDIESTRKKK
jgi:hypothetical protein